MTLQRTLAIIKPTAVAAGHIGEIITYIEQKGFCIRAMRMTRLSNKQAQAFYQVHAERGFFEELCTHMSSGKIVAMLLEKEDAIAQFRKLIGPTDPAQAAPGTIRKDFGISISENAIHGSDSPENGAQEIAFFFDRQTLVGNGH